MHGLVVGVLRGGASREHATSLKTGHTIASHLPAGTFTVKDIYIDPSGVWHERGIPVVPSRILGSLDAVVVGLHGEDGEIQKILESHGVPYTGSGPFGSFLANHKVLAKEKASDLGFRTPRYRLIESNDDLEETAVDIIRSFHQPVVVKSVRPRAVHPSTTVSGYFPVYEAIARMLEGSDGVLVEEKIRGKHASVGIVEGFRGEKLYSLPSIEFTPSDDGGFSGETCPGRFSKEESAELYRIARAMHEALDLRDYSRTDFTVSPRGIYYLETHTLPHLDKHSLFGKSLDSVGIKLSDFLAHVVTLTQERR